MKRYLRAFLRGLLVSTERCFLILSLWGEINNTHLWSLERFLSSMSVSNELWTNPVFSLCILSLFFGLMIYTQRYNQDEGESVNRAGQKQTNKTVTCNE